MRLAPLSLLALAACSSGATPAPPPTPVAVSVPLPPPTQPTPSPPSAHGLASCVPDTVDGFGRAMRQNLEDPPLVAAAYLAAPRSLNVNLGGMDVATARAQLRLLGTDRTETAAAGTLELRGAHVGDLAVQRTWFPRTQKSEVGFLVGDTAVTISIEPAAGPDEALDFVGVVDRGCVAREAR